MLRYIQTEEECVVSKITDVDDGAEVTGAAVEKFAVSDAGPLDVIGLDDGFPVSRKLFCVLCQCGSDSLIKRDRDI